MSDESDSYGDFSKCNEDSVPDPEQPIEHHHPGRPDLDYDDTPVGPAPEVEELRGERREDDGEEGKDYRREE